MNALEKPFMIGTLSRLALLLCALLFGFEASATSDCAQSGGTTACQPAVYTEPDSHVLCDDIGENAIRSAAWCQVRGGTWDPVYTVCNGSSGAPDNATSAGSEVDQFVLLMHGPSCGAGVDPGACSNSNCSCTAQTRHGLSSYEFGVIKRQGATINPDNSCGAGWGERFVFGTIKHVGCPAGMVEDNDPNEVTPCSNPPPCLECVGNPIDVGNGAKMQRDVDYASPAPGGLAFERFYNSSGYFDTVARYQQGSDFWRHNYSSKLFPYTSNAYLMAAVHRPDGQVILFNTSGAEVQKVRGPAHRLQVAGTGWTLTTPESDVETYDSTGKLTLIDRASGVVRC